MTGAVDQVELFEPTPGELPALVLLHIKRGAGHRKAAQLFEARGMPTLANWEHLQAQANDSHAGHLSMLADLYELAGVQ